MDYRSVVREMRRQNKRMYQLTGEAGVAQNDLYEKCMADGALDRKTKELIGIGIGICVRCDACVYGHVEKAVQYGATIEEIAEVCKVGLIMGGGPGTHYSAKAIDCADYYLKLKEEKEKLSEE